MPNNIYHKRNANAGIAPLASQLTVGEIALNTADGKAYTRTTAGTVVELTEPSVADGGEQFTPLNISNLALWLDSSDTSTLYQTEAANFSAATSPLDIANCILWLDGADTTTMFDATSGGSQVVNGGTVARWQDKSGGTRHVTQTNTNLRPTLVTNSLNSKSVIRFDGSNDRLNYDASAANFVRPVTLFVVARKDNTQADGGLFSLSKPATNSYDSDSLFCLTTNSNSAAIRALGGSSTTMYPGVGATTDTLGTFITSLLISSASAIAELRNVGAAQIAIDNSFTFSSSPTNNGFVIGSISTSDGAGGNAYPHPLNGDIAEVIAYSAALSTQDRVRVEKYLAAKWGVSNVHSTVTASATSDPVGAWLDKSGNNRHATQPTAANRPIRAVAANNRNTLLFTGSSTAANAQRLAISNMPANNNELFSVFVVIRETTQTSGIAGRVAIGYRGPTFEYALLSQTFGGASALYWYHAGATPAFPVHNNAAQIYVVQKTATTTTPVSVTLLFNGADITPTPASALGNGGNFGLANFVTSLGSSDGGTNSFTGHICELIAFQRVVSVAERTAVVRYLADRWGISIAPPIVANADAQSWINRAYANGGTVSQSTANAVNTFCNAIDAAGIRDRFYRLNLFCGTNLQACLTPLYRGPSLSGTQFGNTTDTNVNFLATDYNERGSSGGLKGNGSSKYLATGLPMTFLGSNLVHMFVSFLPTTEGITHQLSSRANLSNSLALEAVYTPTSNSVSRPRVALFSVGFQPTGSAAPATGRTQFLAQTANGSVLQSFARNIDLGAFGGGAGAYVSTETTQFYVFTGEQTGTGFVGYSPHWIDSYSLGAAFTTAEGRTAYHDALVTFRNTLNRGQ